MSFSKRLAAELYPAWEDHCYDKANGQQDHPHKPAIAGGKARFEHHFTEVGERIVCTFRGCGWTLEVQG